MSTTVSLANIHPMTTKRRKERKGKERRRKEGRTRFFSLWWEFLGSTLIFSNFFFNLEMFGSPCSEYLWPDYYLDSWEPATFPFQEFRNTLEIIKISLPLLDTQKWKYLPEFPGGSMASGTGIGTAVVRDQSPAWEILLTAGISQKKKKKKKSSPRRMKRL